MTTLRPLAFISFLMCFGSTLFGQGNIISYTLIDSYTQNDVANLITSAGAPTFILQPQFDVDVYRVIYETTDAQGNSTQASGALAIPAGVTCPFPVASYSHGTTSRRYNVPSYLSEEGTIATIFASVEGYVVAAADYLGLGDSPGFHPYVHAATEASANIDLLRATDILQDSLNYNINGQLFLFGYSQGGHAAMATFKTIQENFPTEFAVTAAAPMSGPYDISGVQAHAMIDTVAYSSPGYLPYVVLGYQEAYGNLYTSLSDVFKSPYDTLLPSLFDGTVGFGAINDIVPDTPNQMILESRFQAYMNDPNDPLKVALKDNDLYDWTPQAPLRMMYCTQDEQVFYQNALVTKDSMIANGADPNLIEAINFGPFDHNGCVQSCLLDGRAFFKNYKDTKGGMQIGIQTTPSTAFWANDGAAEISVSGGVGPYTYTWNTGDSTAVVTNIEDGLYSVIIRDSRGCFSEELVEVPTLISTERIEDQQPKQFSLAPNPVDTRVWIHLDQETVAKTPNLVIRNSLGQIVAQFNNIQHTDTEYSVEHLIAGLYTVELRIDGTFVQAQKFIVR